MATWPIGMTEPARAFLTRRQELLEKLRWAPHGSKRRKRYEAELAAIVRGELERETVRSEGARPQARPQWWQQ